MAAVDVYFHALHQGDVEALGEAFHPLARYATASGGVTRILSVPEYLDVVRQRSSPMALGDPAVYTIKAVQMAGADTAVVTLASAMMGREFEDYLSFLFIEDRWRIIAKVFNHRPIQSKGA